MKILKTIAFLLFLFPAAAFGQNFSEILPGDWHIKDFEDYERGETYVTGRDFKARITFSRGGLFTGSRLCNGIGGKYTIDGERIIFTQSGSFTKLACNGVPASIENAFHTFGEEFTLQLEGSDVYITSAGRFRMLLSRFK